MQLPSAQQISQPSSTSNFLLQEIHLQSLLSFKCIHILFFSCWFVLILSGTTLIGYGASIYTQQFDYCSDSQNFCFYDFTLSSTKDLLIYVKVAPFHQNTRLYLDAYSWKQMVGQVGTGRECGNYKTYDSIGVSVTSGGYRVLGTKNVHPCGFPMRSIFRDSAYIVQSDGGTPKISNDTISNYSKQFRFKQLQQSWLSQWVDPESTNFINWMTIGTTSTKYTLVGNLPNISAGEYRLIVKNNWATNNEFSKKIVVSEVSQLGLNNNLIGFVIFAYGLAVLLVHVAICCKGKN